MNNEKIIIVSFSLNFVTHDINVFCYLPGTNILGSHMASETISLPESDLLQSSLNWSNEDLKNAVSAITNVETMNIFYYDEISETEKASIKNTPGNNQFMIKTLV